MGWLLVGAALILVLFGPAEIAGWPRAEVAALLVFAAAILTATLGASRAARGGIGTAVTLWLASVVFLSTAYMHRDAWLGVARDGVGDGVGGLAAQPPDAVVAEGGTVAVTRRRDGHFTVPARVNDRDTLFVFDTGASTVVLSEETARLLGFPPEGLRYRVPVATANGTTLAAPITIDRIAVGSILVRHVPALVARSGLLTGNLLGQTFLDRLDSYEVRGNRLVLRAARSPART